MRKLLDAVRDLVTSVLWGCSHEGAAMPRQGRQWCRDCGAHRVYEIGGTRGPWHRWIKGNPMQRAAAGGQSVTKPFAVMCPPKKPFTPETSQALGELVKAATSYAEQAFQTDVQLDPLEIALSFDVRDGEAWRRVGESSSRNVTLWALQTPHIHVRGFVLAEEMHGGFRSCIRFDVCGRELSKVEGKRVERVGADRTPDNLFVVVRDLLGLVERVMKGAS
jgi:hypothetical protein